MSSRPAEEGWLVDYTWENYAPYVALGAGFLIVAFSADWFASQRGRLAAITLLAVVAAPLGGLFGLILYAPALVVLVWASLRG
ncbi:MAG: hypothetical protein R3C39_13915 [Dehalococcoidia bacterium]